MFERKLGGWPGVALKSRTCIFTVAVSRTRNQRKCGFAAIMKVTTTVITYKVMINYNCTSGDVKPKHSNIREVQ